MLDERFKNISSSIALDIVSCFMKKLMEIEFPADRFYTLKHTWVKIEDGYATVGVSSSVVFLFIPLVEIIFLNVLTSLKKNDPCVWIVHRDGVLTIRSPVEGELFEINKALLKSPNILNQDPYFEGWLFKVKLDKKENLSELLDHSKFIQIYNEKIEKFRSEIHSALSDSIEPASVPTVQNGGKIVETVKDLLGAKRYFALVGKTFGLF
jgi:glycine cleavage system H protein